jgi:hypothetical protein
VLALESRIEYQFIIIIRFYFKLLENTELPSWD